MGNEVYEPIKKVYNWSQIRIIRWILCDICSCSINKYKL